VQKGRDVRRDLGERKLTDDEEQARRALLFNQTNDKVRQAREAAVKAGR